MATMSSSKASADAGPVVAVDRQVVMSASDVLHESVTGNDDRSQPRPFQSSHEPQTGLEAGVIGFDAVVGILIGDVAGAGEQLVEHRRVHARQVGGHLHRRRRGSQRLLEEPAAGTKIAAVEQENIDDLAVLVHRPVQVHPAAPAR